MEQVKYLMYRNYIEELKDEFENIIKNIDSTNCENLVSEYKVDWQNQSKKDAFEIAFIGQYNAGKSSIITALTGNMDIKTGQNITTDKVTVYDWNNVFLVDTPGIGTDHKEHDDLAYKHMDLADLLVYVVTTQGFDDLIAKDFKKIAFERNMLGKMMLVVNKTSLESISNKVNWEGDIKNVIYPVTLEELRVTFIDAKDYLDALEEEDINDKNDLTVLSNFNDFIFNLNDFIKEKGIAGRLIAEINLIDTYLIKILNEISTDSESKNIQELFMRKKFFVEENKKSIDKKVKIEIDNLYTGIMNISNEFIAKLTDGYDAKVINEDFEDVKERIDRLCNDMVEKIDDIVDFELDELINKINSLESTLLYKEIMNDFTKDIDFNVNVNEKIDFEKLKKAPDALKDVGRFLGVGGKGFKNWCTNAENLGKGIKVASGSDAHKFVLQIGHFFGKKFKPYEAVKIANKLGKAGDIMAKVGSKVSIVAGVASPFIALFEEYQENANEKQLNDARIETRKNFRIWATDIKQNALNMEKELLSNVHDKELENINNSISKLRNEDMLKGEQSKELINLQDKIVSIIKHVDDIN